MKREKIRSFLSRQGLPLLCFLAAYGLMVCFYARNGMNSLNADVSSEFVLADLLNQEGGLLSANWLYSTELRVVSPVPVYQLGLMLFSTWHGARVFSIAVLMLGVTLSLLYALRGAGAGDIALYAAAAIILPVSWQYTFLFSYGGFYTVYFIVTCLLMGLVLRLDRSKGRVRRLLLIALLSVYSGLGGVRMPMVCGAPLFAACGVQLLCHAAKQQTLRRSMVSKEASMFIGAALCLAGMAVGYWVNMEVLAARYSFTLYDGVYVQDFSLSELMAQLDYIPILLGLHGDAPMLSLSGLVSLCALGVSVLLPVSVLCLYRLRARLSTGEKTLVLFAVCASVLGLIVNVTTHKGRDNTFSVAYYLPGLLMLLTGVFLLLGRMPCVLRGLRQILCAALCGVFLLNAFFSLQMNYRSTPEVCVEAAQWLIENGYEAGYASFWNANSIAEASDGKLEMYSYNNWSEKTPAAWLQKVSHLTDMPEGRVFAYVNESEKSYAPCALADHKVWEVPDGAIYVFDSAQELMHIQAGGMSAQATEAE